MWLQESIIGALRRLGLLSAYDRAKYFVLYLIHAGERRALQRSEADFPVPPPALAYDAYAHIRYSEYRETGLRDGQHIAGLINEHAGGQNLKILEWGCGPGRVIRHLQKFLAGPAELTGADYNRDSVAWCRAHLDGITFVENDVEPPLPFDAGRFDVVYALSVFTHLSEPLHAAWIDELARVLKPGGLLLLTLHGDFFRDRHLNADERADYERGRLVTRGRVAVGKKWFAAFHPPAYVERRLLAGFDLLKHRPGPISAGFEQDVWVARKTRGDR